MTQIRDDEAVRSVGVTAPGSLIDVSPGTASDEDALIKEARRRQRRRRAWFAGGLALVVIAAPLGFALADQRSSPPPSPTSSSGALSAQRFIQLAEAGASRNFAASYQVTGAHTGVIDVAQKQHPEAFNPGSGTWSFLYRANLGLSYQWIQKGSSGYDCWQAAGDASWTCTGPGAYHQVNGFALAVEPFVPFDVVSELNQLQEALGHKGWVKGLSISRGESKLFGSLTCLKVMALTLSAPTTMCIDHAGTMVSVQNWPGGYFSDVTLERYGASIPATAFNPLASPHPGLVPTPQ